MKRVVLFGLVACLVVGAGGWFGVPYYAQNRFEAALDAYFAGRGTGVGYRDAKYDYWQRRATLGEITDVGIPPSGGAPVLFTATDVVVEGINADAMGEVAASAAGSATALADGASWSALSMRSDDADRGFTLTSGTGGVQGITVTRRETAAGSRLALAGVDRGTLAQTRLEVKAPGGAFSAQANSMRLSALSAAGADEVSVEGLTAETRFEAGDEPGEVKGAWDALAVSGITTGPVLLVDRIEQTGMTFEVSMPGVEVPVAPPVTAADGTVTGPPETEPLKVLLTYTDVVLEKLALGADLLTAYGSVIENTELMGQPNPPPWVVAAWVESLIVVLERTQQGDVGADRMVLRDMVVEFGRLQKQSAEVISLVGQRGLKVDRMETTNQVQVDLLGNRFATERTSVSNIDFSGLPAYLRALFGSPVTAENLSSAGERLQASLLGGDLPSFDYGQWEIAGQTFETAGRPPMTIGRMALEPLVVSDDGRVRTALSLSGIAVPLDALPTEDPDTQLAVGAMRAQGIETLNIGFAITVLLDLRQGTFALEGIELSAERLATVSLDASASGIRLAQFADVPAEQRAQVAMVSAALDGAALSLRDEGLRRLAFTLLGQGQGATPEQMAEALSAQVGQTVASLGTERAQRLAVTAARFIRDGGSLQLASQAAQPVPVIQLMETMQLAGPAGILDLLEFEARNGR